MKKITIILVFIFLAVGWILAQEYDFRSTRWGMTAKEVRGVEKAKLVSKSGDERKYRLVYNTAISEFKGSIVYYFTEYKLRSARYSFEVVESGKAIDDYRYFKELLIKKYGPPQSSKKKYSDHKKSELGPLYYLLLLPMNFKITENLEAGDLSLESTWANDFTYITLVLQLNKKKELFTIDIIYEHKRWADDQKREQEERKKLEEKALLDAI
jgi:hypothetical protein